MDQNGSDSHGQDAPDPEQPSALYSVQAELRLEVFDDAWLQEQEAIILLLKTTCRDFELWLTSTLQPAQTRSVPAKRGRIILDQPRVNVGPGGRLTFEFRGTYFFRHNGHKQKPALPYDRSLSLGRLI